MTRRTTFVSWRTFGWLGVIALLVLPFTLLIGAPTRNHVERGIGNDSDTIDIGVPGARGGQGSLSEAELRFLQKES